MECTASGGGRRILPLADDDCLPVSAAAAGAPPSLPDVACATPLLLSLLPGMAAGALSVIYKAAPCRSGRKGRGRQTAQLAPAWVPVRRQHCEAGLNVRALHQKKKGSLWARGRQSRSGALFLALPPCPPSCCPAAPHARRPMQSPADWLGSAKAATVHLLAGTALDRRGAGTTSGWCSERFVSLQNRTALGLPTDAGGRCEHVGRGCGRRACCGCKSLLRTLALLWRQQGWNLLSSNRGALQEPGPLGCGAEAGLADRAALAARRSPPPFGTTAP